MTRVPDDKRRAVEPYLKFLRLLDDEVELDTRVAHILDEFTAEDFERLSVTLRDFGVTAGFSVPAIHLESRDSLSPAISTLAEDGHEILLHGYRHTSCRETHYGTAAAELEAAVDRFEADLDVRPTGFHVPFMRCSPGAVRAAEEHGLEWIVGAEISGADTSIEFLQPVSPYDLQLFGQGHTEAEVADRMNEATDDAPMLLCHPNIHAVHDARESFAEFLAEGTFARPSAVAAVETDRTGLLLDCFPPFGVR